MSYYPEPTMRIVMQSLWECRVCKKQVFLLHSDARVCGACRDENPELYWRCWCSECIDKTNERLNEESRESSRKWQEEYERTKHLPKPPSPPPDPDAVVVKPKAVVVLITEKEIESWPRSNIRVFTIKHRYHLAPN